MPLPIERWLRNEMTAGSVDERAASLEASLLALARRIVEEEAAQKPRIDAVLPRHRPSAKNLAHGTRLIAHIVVKA